MPRGRPRKVPGVHYETDDGQSTNGNTDMITLDYDQALADAARLLQSQQRQIERLQEMVSFLAANVAATQLAVGLRNERNLISSPWAKEGLVATSNFSPATYDVFVQRARSFLETLGDDGSSRAA